jgi:hypothetical protein
MYFTENPLEFHAWLECHLGQGHLDLLREKKNTIFKTTRAVRLDIAKHYRDEFRRMVNSGNVDLVSYQ